jgi:ribulose-5-phosphate 4-epimerase/fuculose-1-phosphate aldolase
MHKQFKDTLLHVWLARQQQAQVIVQTHSVWSALLADRFGTLDGVLLENFELLQRLPDADSESHVEWLPIVMSYDQTPLIQAVERTIKDTPAEMTRPPRALLIQKYGMVTWAEDSDKAQNQAELFEYFCEYLVRRASLN